MPKWGGGGTDTPAARKKCAKLAPNQPRTFTLGGTLYKKFLALSNTVIRPKLLLTRSYCIWKGFWD